MKTRATVLLFIAAVIWGVAFVAQRTAMDYVGAFTFNGARFLLGSISLLPVVALFEKIERADRVRTVQANKADKAGKADKADRADSSVSADKAVRANIANSFVSRKSQTNNGASVYARRIRFTVITGLIGGTVLFIAAALQQVGVQITLSAGRSGFVTGLYIVLTPLLGMALGKKTGASTWVGAVVACAGLYFLCVPTDLRVNAGDLALLAGAIFWAVHILTIDRFAGRIYSLRFAVVQFFTCGALSMVCALVFEKPTLTAMLSGYFPILYSALLSVGIAYTLQIVGQRHVEPAKAALIYSLESLFAALGGALLLGETMELRAYAGCGLIFAGILLSQIRLKKPPTQFITRLLTKSLTY